jgi:predicted component of type VI protein secretion system
MYLERYLAVRTHRDGARKECGMSQGANTPRLIVLTPDSCRGQRIDLDKEYMLVGRDPTCEVRLNDPHVSRTHAALQRRGTAVFVQDLGSFGGTFVNGAAATTHSAGTLATAGNVLIGPLQTLAAWLGDIAQPVLHLLAALG